VEVVVGKSGGFFKGFKPHLSSSSNAFAKRGDPWVTKREGEEGYDRQVEIENPDMDADRQRNARLEGFSKEFRDRVKPEIDFKMTMREAIETERSTRLDGYQAKKGLPKPKPKAGEWPKRGVDFEVATVQRKMVNNALRFKNSIAPTSTARVDTTVKVSCPRGCGLSAADSRLISKHLQRYRNSCCTHSTGCNCPDCRLARNDP
jgi:hypothetical protein